MLTNQLGHGILTNTWPLDLPPGPDPLNDVSGSPTEPGPPSIIPGDQNPQDQAPQSPIAHPAAVEDPRCHQLVKDTQPVVGKKRYRLEQMVAEAVEAERKARQERLRRQDLGPLSAALSKGLMDAHRKGEGGSADSTCLTMEQLARQCFGRGKLHLRVGCGFPSEYSSLERKLGIVEMRNRGALPYLKY